MHADRDATRAWISANSYQDTAELQFLPNTSSAVVAIYGYETDGAFTIDAGLGQLLTFELVDGPAPANISGNRPIDGSDLVWARGDGASVRWVVRRPH